MLSYIRQFLSPSHSVDQAQFDNIMSMAHAIAKKNPSGLYSFVRALLLPIQAEQMLAVAERQLHEAPQELEWHTFFFRIFPVATIDELYRQDKPVVSVSLARDVVLTTPWHRSRYESALTNIGEGKPCGSWRVDSNHSLALCWPWRISFVVGGNHSIAAGILDGDGEMTATEVFDFSPVLHRVYCNGKEYRTISGDDLIAAVDDPRKAAVYEIGRIMIKNDQALDFLSCATST